MAKNPSTRWYFKDWQTDLGLRKCSAAARGLWMEMLCIAAAATPMGYVQMGDKPCDVVDLALCTGWDKRSVGRWLAELERHGVFSRNDAGTIYNRRMVRGGNLHRTPKRTHQDKSANQPELFENSKKTRTRACPPLNPGPEGTSTDSLTTSDPLPSSEAACAREEEGLDNEKGNPEEARCARLGGGEPRTGEAAPVGRVRPRSLPANQRDLEDQNYDNPRQEPAMDSRHGFSPVLAASRPILGAVAILGRPPRCPKSPALKAKIKLQCVWKHCRFLKARGRPGEWEWYFDQIDPKTQLVPDEIFETIDARMRAERWDDMRAWKRQHGIPCDGNDASGTRGETASELLVRTGGWYHGKTLTIA